MKCKLSKALALSEDSWTRIEELDQESSVENSKPIPCMNIAKFGKGVDKCHENTETGKDKHSWHTIENTANIVIAIHVSVGLGPPKNC